ncbi:MAG: hypothetical protein DMG16_29885, partial [Acidobacteria bacterium]
KCCSSHGTVRAKLRGVDLKGLRFRPKLTQLLTHFHISLSIFISNKLQADARDLKCGSCLIIERQSDSCARAWRNGIRSGLKKYLSARRETGDAELLKVGETSKWQSRAKPGETPAGKV